MILDSLTPYDRVQLLEIYSRSVMLLELGRPKEWVNLFAQNALLYCTGPNDAASVQFKGHGELLALGHRIMLGEFDLALGPLTPPSRHRHLLNNITLFENDRRHASGYAILTITTLGGPEPPRPLASGIYTDSLHKNAAGCWQFETRTFTPDTAAAPALVGADPMPPVSANPAAHSQPV
jgi:hypothetical protein